MSPKEEKRKHSKLAFSSDILAADVRWLYASTRVGFVSLFLGLCCRPLFHAPPRPPAMLMRLSFQLNSLNAFFSRFVLVCAIFLARCVLHDVFCTIRVARFLLRDSFCAIRQFVLLFITIVDTLKPFLQLFFGTIIGTIFGTIIGTVCGNIRFLSRFRGKDDCNKGKNRHLKIIYLEIHLSTRDYFPRPPRKALKRLEILQTANSAQTLSQSLFRTPPRSRPCSRSHSSAPLQDPTPDSVSHNFARPRSVRPPSERFPSALPSAAPCSFALSSWATLHLREGLLRVGIYDTWESTGCSAGKINKNTIKTEARGTSTKIEENNTTRVKKQ